MCMIYPTNFLGWSQSPLWNSMHPIHPMLLGKRCCGGFGKLKKKVFGFDPQCIETRIEQRKHWLVGGFNPSEKYESQLGWLFPIYGKIKNVPNHQPVEFWPPKLGIAIDQISSQRFSSGTCVTQVNGPISVPPQQYVGLRANPKQKSLEGQILGGCWDVIDWHFRLLSETSLFACKIPNRCSSKFCWPISNKRST